MLQQPKFTPKYLAYLDSPEWKARRAALIEKAGGRCAVCDGGGVLQAHHKTYANLGHEEDGDLIVLCVGCHKLFTENRRISQSPRAPVQRPKRRRDGRRTEMPEKAPKPKGVFLTSVVIEGAKKNTQSFMAYIRSRTGNGATSVFARRLAGDPEFLSEYLANPEGYQVYKTFVRLRWAPTQSDMGCLSWLWGAYLEAKRRFAKM